MKLAQLNVFTSVFLALFIVASLTAHADAGFTAEADSPESASPNSVNPDDPNLPDGLRPQTPIEVSITKALRQLSKKSPAVFDFICLRCSQLPESQKEDFFTNWQVQGPLSVLTDSMNAPSTLWDYGLPRSSKLVALRMDIFIEGFYRNFQLEAGGQKKLAQPWLKYNVVKKVYTVMPSGAGAAIYKHLLLQNDDSKSRTLTLYRGTSQTESDHLIQIQRLAMNPATKSQAIAQAKEMARSFKNGLYASDFQETAQRSSELVQQDKPTVLTIKLSAAALKGMIDRGEVYVGYDADSSEFRFLSASAILSFAEGLQK